MKITKDMKIEALERLVKAIFGRQEPEIKYQKNFKDIIEIRVECDVDDAVKLISNLEVADIDYWFFTEEKKIDPKYSKWKDCNWEGITTINIILETRYWKRVKELEKELKELKAKTLK